MSLTRHASVLLCILGAVVVPCGVAGSVALGGSTQRSEAAQKSASARGAAAAQGNRIDVAFVKQVREGCGSAVLAMLLGYWNRHGHTIAEERSDAAYIHGQVYSKRQHGSPASAVERYLRAAGFRTYAFSGTWNDITEHIAQGRPIIVALRPPTALRRLHYALVVGAGENHLLMHDPANAPSQLLRRDEFERQWRPARFWMLLALPPA